MADAVIEALRRLEREPDAGRILRGRLAGLRSLRIGAYRILYVLSDGEREVRVLAIRHRSIAYGSDLALRPAESPHALKLHNDPKPLRAGMASVDLLDHLTVTNREDQAAGSRGRVQSRLEDADPNGNVRVSHRP